MAEVIATAKTTSDTEDLSDNIPDDVNTGLEVIKKMKKYAHIRREQIKTNGGIIYFIFAIENIGSTNP